jgi:hypothetical protein
MDASGKCAVAQTQTNQYKTEARPLQWCLAILVALVALKVFVLMFGLGASKAPWGLFVVIVVPAAMLAFVNAKYPRVGAAATAILMALFIAIVGSALLRDGFARESWADYPVAYGGLVLAAVAVFWALRILRLAR